MYILTFNRSKSINFEKGLDLALSLGGNWDGQQLLLEIPDEELLEAYELLFPLFELIQNWSSTKATYNGREVHPYRFILSMHFIDECASESKLDHENCWMSYGYPGWTCKKITNIFFFESGDGDYENNQRYWYNYGKFNSKNEWVIDKSGIYKNLILFAESNALNLCPYYSAEKVKAAVDQLRSRIIPDNYTFRVHYTDLYEGGEHLKFPENIRHIPMRDFPKGARYKYDLKQIEIIRRFESGEISAKAMKELLRMTIEKN